MDALFSIRIVMVRITQTFSEVKDFGPTPFNKKKYASVRNLTNFV